MSICLDLELEVERHTPKRDTHINLERQSYDDGVARTWPLSYFCGNTSIRQDKGLEEVNCIIQRGTGEKIEYFNLLHHDEG